MENTNIYRGGAKGGGGGERGQVPPLAPQKMYFK